MALQQIVVPLDGSQLAERALPYASALARLGGGRLILVRAAMAHIFPGQDVEAAQIAVTERAETELTDVTNRLRADRLDVEPHLCYDDAASAILGVTDRVKADLIVMSTHGRSGLGRWIYGSVADEVLRHAQVPVLLVPSVCERTWPEGRPLRILVPLDGSELAESALIPARDLAQQVGAEIVLLRIVEPIVAGYPETYPFDIEPDLNTVESYVTNLASELRQAGLSVTAVADFGYPVSRIVATATEKQADLIVMATHGHGGIARLVLGSVATGVAQRAHTPLFLSRPSAVHSTIASAPGAVAAASSSPESLVVVALSAAELELVRRGLSELAYRPESDDQSVAAARRLMEQLRGKQVTKASGPASPSA
ncbi:MAG: universal stress protein [Chloroflexi bacterium]|nr:universal stress protein [Chloroflexota bacterium]